MLDFERAFSDRKRAWQGRGAYSRIPNRYPALVEKPPKTNKKETLKKAIKPVFPRYAARQANKDDAEMGFLPILAAAIPAATSLVTSLFGKKSSKTGAAPPEAGLAKQVLDAITQAGGASASGSVDIKDIVKNIVATVPSPVIAQVKAAIAEMKDKSLADEKARDLVTTKIDAQFQPQITAMLAALKTQKDQTQATYEHERIKARDAFRGNTTTSLNTTLQSLNNLSKRLSAIEARLQTSAVVTNQNKIALLGGKSIVDG